MAIIWKWSQPLVRRAITSWPLDIRWWWMVLDLVHTSEAEMDQEHSEDFFFPLVLWRPHHHIFYSLTHNAYIVGGNFCGVMWFESRVLVQPWGHMLEICRTRMLFPPRPCNPSSGAQGPWKNPAICCSFLIYFHIFHLIIQFTHEISLSASLPLTLAHSSPILCFVLFGFTFLGLG